MDSAQPQILDLIAQVAERAVERLASLSSQAALRSRILPPGVSIPIRPIGPSALAISKVQSFICFVR
jgi:hypothetical protein